MARSRASGAGCGSARWARASARRLVLSVRRVAAETAAQPLRTKRSIVASRKSVSAQSSIPTDSPKAASRPAA